MIARLVQAAGLLFVCFCVGTTLALALGGAYAWYVGYLEQGRVVRALAALHGAELPDEASKAAAEKTDTEDQQKPDPEMLRARLQRDIELREQAVAAGLDYLRFLQKKLDEDRSRYDQLWAGFENQLKNLREGAVAAGRGNVREVWENIRPRQAKDQIMDLLKEPGGAEEVVLILTQMPIDRRARIIGEFKTDEEREKLHVVLELMRRGMPETKLIDNARNQLEEAKPN